VAAEVAVNFAGEAQSSLPLPVVTGSDGYDYTPLKALGHVIGMRPESVEGTVSALRSAAATAAERAKAIPPSLTMAASTLKGMTSNHDCLFELCTVRAVLFKLVDNQMSPGDQNAGP